MAQEAINTSQVTTTTEVPGFRVAVILGVVLGICVRMVPDVKAAVAEVERGGVPGFHEMAKQACRSAYQDMLKEAARLGADGVIGVHYETGETVQGVAETLCYGTAVLFEPTS
jgi:uncharacterized protein YbjQ (UPF0145 family)